MPNDTPARARRKLLPSNLLPTPWSEPSREERDILMALRAASPRAFWEASKRHAFSHRHASFDFIKAFGEDERLLRMALWRMAKPDQDWTLGADAGRAAAHANFLIQRAYLLGQERGRPLSWAGSRALRLAPHYKQLAANHLFHLLGVCAAHGDLESAQALGAIFPDANDPAQKRRSFCGHVYARQEFGDAEGRSWARKAIAGKAPKRPEGRSIPSNPLFWCAARAASGTQAEAWGQLGALLMSRLDPKDLDGPELLCSALTCPPMRARFPASASPSFYSSFSRVALLNEHLPLIADEELALSCTIDAAIAPAQIPALALAMLQGRKLPQSCAALWQAQSALEFRAPLAVVALAKAGAKVERQWTQSAHQTGKAFTLDSLAKALGRALAWESEPAPPKPRARRPKA